MTFLLAMLLAATPPPLIVDTDAGTDDLLAIAYLLSRHDVQIEAITVVSGVAHVGMGAANIQHLLHAAGRDDIRVYVGSATTPHAFPEEWRKPSDGIFSLIAHAKYPSASEYLKSRLQSPCRILALGPLTNVAAALGPRNAVSQLLIMGGAVRVPGNVDAEPPAEWNIYADPAAAQKVFASGMPITLIPLDATNQVPIHAAYLKHFEDQSATPLAKLVAHILKVAPPPYAWDPLAAVALTNPETMRTASIAVVVSPAGRTREFPNKLPNASVAFHVNAPLFEKLFLQAFVP